MCIRDRAATSEGATDLPGGDTAAAEAVALFHRCAPSGSAASGNGCLVLVAGFQPEGRGSLRGAPASLGMAEEPLIFVGGFKDDSL
eukprot:3387261-Alexandrium_andersonii.AAC.1